MDALDDDTECGSVARDSLQQESASEHLGKGLQYYLGDVIHLLQQNSSKKVYLVRSDSMQADIDGIGPALLGMSAGSLNTTVEHKKDDYPRKDDTLLSDWGRMLLKRELHREYWLLDVLEQVAVNGRSVVRMPPPVPDPVH